MTNWDLFRYTNFILNQDVSGNMIRPADFDRLLKIHSERHFYTLLERYEVDKVNTHSIQRFRKSSDLSLTSGAVDVPEDFKYFSTAYYLDGANYREIDFITAEEITQRISSSIMMPTGKNPVGYIKAGEIIILPDTITDFTLVYLKKPSEPSFVVTYDLDDNMVYGATSVELDYEYIDKLQVAYNILADRGINVRDGNVVQFSQFVKENKE